MSNPGHEGPQRESGSQFVTSSFCLGGECVAVAATSEGVVVRSTTTGAEVGFSDSEWVAFVAGVRNAEFDLSRLRS